MLPTIYSINISFATNFMDGEKWLKIIIILYFLKDFILKELK